MRYKYLGKHPHNLIIKGVKTVLCRGDEVELPERVKRRKVGRRFGAAIKVKEVEKI